MTYILGSASRARLAGVHPRLVAVVERAIQIAAVDFKVIEGVRTDEQCYVNYGKGRTAAELRVKGVPAPERYARPGERKVTWLTQPLNSMHRKKADGYGHAVDLLPAPYDWSTEAADGSNPFDTVAKAMLAAADELGVAIRWGKDWNRNGRPGEKGETDSPHFELA